MKDEQLYNFYQSIILPKFGINDVSVTWNYSQNVGTDESVHYFSVDRQEYALVFEDYMGKGNDPAFITEHVALRNPKYTVIPPLRSTSPDSNQLSINNKSGFEFTGTFTLVKLQT